MRRKVFARRVVRSKLPRIRFHDLRHTHVSRLIEADEPPPLTTPWLGLASHGLLPRKVCAPLEDAGSQAAFAVDAMVNEA